MSPNHTPPKPGSGALRARLDEILRVDHAGELAAVHIYRAQAAVFSATSKQDLGENMKRMEAEEQVHLDRFETLMRDQNVRPTLMTPIWRLAALGLGATTALMGEKAAHACTEAVEHVISEHYDSQIAETKVRYPDLSAELKTFRDDELRHHDQAIEDGAHQAPFYPVLTALIKGGCRLAIKISEKV
jgi:3-demethoxyubiquinol 3-hydroxylase